MDAFDRRAITRSLSASGFLRRSAWRDGGPAGHREWLHFTIRDGALQLVVNVSIVDDLRPAAQPHRERVRVLVLAHDGERWHGDLDEIADADCDVRGGQLHVQAGATTISLHGGNIRVHGRLRRKPIAFQLELAPCTFPSLATNVTLAGSAPINWLVVPHLTASGRLTLGERIVTLHDAPAYHDHNWGHFSHRDFAWQWGHASAVGAYNVVLARLLDAAHANVFMQSLLVWRGARQARVFRGEDIRVIPEGFLRPARPFTVPAIGTLLVGARASEVPQRLHIHAAADGDEVHAVFDARHVARVTVPHDHDLGTTIIHEVIGHLRLSGRLHDEPIEADAPAMFELLGSAS